MNALQQLIRHGQSVWLDNLTRGLIQRGELARRVGLGLRGVTSNPAIFQKAITEGDEYDDDIRRLSAAAVEPAEAYERLVVDDVRAACDVLRGVWEESDGSDGFVSLEVSPRLAHDGEATLAEARRLYEAVDRPNVLIKIPGTVEGVPAIQEALFEGININITLLFAIPAYEAVAEAHMRALERRLEAGRRVDDVASVASFFLSRIDTLTDERLEARAKEADLAAAARIRRLLGEAAIASAKLAYESFGRRLGSARWTRLAEAGARPQRMLWASTSTKNPEYSDVKYVEPLIGPHTINTMPESTIEAFLDHGSVGLTIRDGVERARDVINDLEEAGIDFADVTDTLLVEGVRKFVEPFDSLLESLAERLGTAGAAPIS